MPLPGRGPANNKRIRREVVMIIDNLMRKLGRLALVVVLAASALTFGISTTAHAAPDVKINMHGGAGLWFEFYFILSNGDNYVVAVKGDTNGTVTLLQEGSFLDYVNVYQGGTPQAAPTGSGYIPGSTVVGGGVFITTLGADNIAHRNNKQALLVDDGSLGNANSDGRRQVNSGTCNFWCRIGSIEQGTSIGLYAEKYAGGYSLASVAGLFKFYAFLLDGDGNPVGAPVAEGTNDALGRVFFSPDLQYGIDDIGQTFTYLIVEDNTPVANWILDSSSYTVTVEVETYTSGQNILLRALPTYNPQTGIVFINSYNGPPVPYLTTTLNLSAKKSVIGVDLADIASVFQFEALDENGNTLSATNDALGNISFSAITYDNQDVGLHMYTIREIPADLAEWKYDTGEFIVTVQVELLVADGASFTLSATIISIEKDGIEMDEVEFTNEKTHGFILPLVPGGPVPSTGDTAPWLLLGVCLFALVGIAAGLAASKQRRDSV